MRKKTRKLQEAIEGQIRKVPHLLLKKLIARKLNEQGVDEPALLDALIKHIEDKSKDKFHWDDGSQDERNLSIDFTKEDMDQLEKDVKEFIRVNVPEAIFRSVDHGARLILKNFEKRWPEARVDERNGAQHFRDRLELRWGPCLDALRMMLTASREVGDAFSNRLARSRAKKGIVTREVTLALHLRACQTALEIITLLENGLPDGAYARWRTLYEISVVAFFISRFGDEAAERYVAHDIVAMRDSTANEFHHDGLTYDASKLTGALKAQEVEYDAAVMKFGKSFKGPYGWAAHSLNIAAPRFQDLEKAIEWGTLPPNYKSSSFKVHAGIAGTIRTLGSIGDDVFIHSGATNAGLQIPAMNAAYSLLHVTSLVFENVRDIEVQIQMKSMILLREKVVSAGRRASKKLEKDEMLIRQSNSSI